MSFRMRINLRHLLEATEMWRTHDVFDLEDSVDGYEWGMAIESKKVNEFNAKFNTLHEMDAASLAYVYENSPVMITQSIYDKHNCRLTVSFHQALGQYVKDDSIVFTEEEWLAFCKGLKVQKNTCCCGAAAVGYTAKGRFHAANYCPMYAPDQEEE